MTDPISPEDLEVPEMNDEQIIRKDRLRYYIDQAAQAELDKLVARVEELEGALREARKESRLSPVPHDYEVVGEEYGSLGDGGSYEVLKCRNCARTAYSQMAD